jgi:hypothetical protein
MFAKLNRLFCGESRDAYDYGDTLSDFLRYEFSNLLSLVVGLREPFTGCAIDKETMHLVIEVPIKERIECLPIYLAT